jgi:putative transposase
VPTTAEAVTAGPGRPAASKKRPPAGKFEIPGGWVARGFEFEVEWPGDSDRAARIRSHFGARRKAYNWALGQVKADLDAHKGDLAHVSAPWNLYALRKRWNAEKDLVAPWWAENSKEAYAAGIADLCAALRNWSASRRGARKGRKAGFPRFRAKSRDQGRVRFTTGPMRAEADRRTITLPVIGGPALEGEHPPP